MCKSWGGSNYKGDGPAYYNWFGYQWVFFSNLVTKEVCILHVLLEDLIPMRIYRVMVDYSF